MSIPLNVNGAVFEYPVDFDENWGVDATGWAQAITNGVLQLQGGSFPLTANINFGPNFGLLSQYFQTRAAAPAATGTVRLSSADAGIAWRNNANNANLVLTTNASDQLLYNGFPIATSGAGAVTSIIGTADQISASSPTGAVTLSTPQNIAPTSSPTFAALTLTAPLAVANGGTGQTSFATGALSSNGTTLTSGTLSVPNGGTGNTSFTAFSVIAAGTTSTGPFQNISGLGLSGQALTSNGAGLLPTWQNVAGSGTVNTGVAGEIAYYATSTNVVSSLSALSFVSPTLTYTVPGVDPTFSITGDATGTSVFKQISNSLTTDITTEVNGRFTISDPDNGVIVLRYTRPSTISTTPRWDFSSGLDITGVTSASFITAATSSATSINASFANTENATGTADCELLIKSGGASGGDSRLVFNITGVQSYAVGIDNSDGDLFKIQTGGSFAAGANAVIVSTTGEVSIRGTESASNAPTGYVGEYIESVQSVLQNAPTTNQFGDLASVALTAGDWDVTGTIFWTSNGATWSSVQLGISATSGNSSAGLVSGSNYFTHTFASTSTAITQLSLCVPSYRVSLGGSVTYYLKYLATYSAGTPQAAGRISARRVR